MMEVRVVDLESRQALRRERRRRQVRRARFLQAIVWVLAIAGLIVLGREMFSMFRRISSLPDHPAPLRRRDFAGTPGFGGPRPAGTGRD